MNHTVISFALTTRRATAMPKLNDLIPDQEMEPRVFLRTMGVLIWVSFLFAGIGSGLFFATFDPVEIAAIATFAMTLDPLTGYTIGFFLFWVFGFCCSTLSWLLLALPLSKRRKPMPD